MAFLGLKHQLGSITEVFGNETIASELKSYMDLVRKALVVGYGMTEGEVKYWDNLYDTRFMNSIKSTAKAATSKSTGSARGFDSVVRNMLRKISYNERFVLPLIILRKHGEDISAGISLIADIAAYEKNRQNMSMEELSETLKEMWCVDEYGQYLYDEVIRRLNA